MTKKFRAIIQVADDLPDYPDKYVRSEVHTLCGKTLEVLLEVNDEFKYLVVKDNLQYRDMVTEDLGEETLLLLEKDFTIIMQKPLEE